MGLIEIGGSSSEVWGIPILHSIKLYTKVDYLFLHILTFFCENKTFFLPDIKGPGNRGIALRVSARRSVEE